MTPTNTNAAGYWAQLDLPNGASVDYVLGVVYDNDPGAGLDLFFGGYEVAPWTGPASDTLFATGSTGDPATPGFTAIELYLNPPIIIHEQADLDGDGVKNVVAYDLILTTGNQSGVNLLAFWGAVVHWSRTVSPAPATATFSDVPTGHWAFQFVEALAASGITAGCGGGNYCPDQPITRAEMAVYLSAALGLHWVN